MYQSGDIINYQTTRGNSRAATVIEDKGRAVKVEKDDGKIAFWYFSGFGMTIQTISVGKATTIGYVE